MNKSSVCNLYYYYDGQTHVCLYHKHCDRAFSTFSTVPIAPKYCESYPVYQLSVSNTGDHCSLIRVHSQWTHTMVRQYYYYAAIDPIVIITWSI